LDKLPFVKLNVPLSSENFFVTFWPFIVKHNLGIKFGFRKDGSSDYRVVSSFQVTNTNILEDQFPALYSPRIWGKPIASLDYRPGFKDAGLLKILISNETPITFCVCIIILIYNLIEDHGLNYHVFKGVEEF